MGALFRISSLMLLLRVRSAAPQDVEPQELKAQTERKRHRRKSVDVVSGTSSGPRAQPHVDPGCRDLLWFYPSCSSEQERGSRLGIPHPKASLMSPRGHSSVPTPLCLWEQLCVTQSISGRQPSEPSPAPGVGAGITLLPCPAPAAPATNGPAARHKTALKNQKCK